MNSYTVIGIDRDDEDCWMIRVLANSAEHAVEEAIQQLTHPPSDIACDPAEIQVQYVFRGSPKNLMTDKMIDQEDLRVSREWDARDNA